MEDKINKDIATTFLKGLSVIEAFDYENPSMTLTEVAKKVTSAVPTGCSNWTKTETNSPVKVLPKAIVEDSNPTGRL